MIIPKLLQFLLAVSLEKLLKSLCFLCIHANIYEENEQKHSYIYEMENKYITSTEAAELLGIHRTTIRAVVKLGLLTDYSNHKHRRLNKAEVLELAKTTKHLTKRGRKPLSIEEKKKVVSVAMLPQDHEILKQEAKLRGLSVSAFVSGLLNCWLQAKEETCLEKN